MSKCDQDVYEHGICVGLVRTLPSAVIDLIVADMRQWVPKAKIDWHWYAGRALIKVLGSPFDTQHARECFSKYMSVVFEGGAISYHAEPTA